MTERISLNLVSEVALAEGGAPRPIHILRVGTFTGMSGTPFTFTPEHIRNIVENFQAGKRKKPPITERHDYGRAVGRMQDVWADAQYENLYSLPKWNAEGRKLLADEVYDGFSVELDPDDAGYVLVGGSLTNYPAVNGLEAVTLQAPAAQPLELTTPPIFETPTDPTPMAPLPVLSQPGADMQPTTQPTEVLPMSEPIAEGTPPTVNLPPISDPSVQARLDAFIAQQTALLTQREREIEERVRMDFERRMLETDQRNAVHAFARSRTMTNVDQPYAIPGTAEELAQLLLETPAAVRGKWQTLLTRITTAGLLSFDEIGSSGEEGEAADRWTIIVNAKVAAGLPRSQAIIAAAKEHPDLYGAQNRAKKGGR